MPDVNSQTAPAPSRKDEILAKLKSLGDGTASFIKSNPELVAGTAAAGLGGVIGGKATGTVTGALTGAAVGGGLTAALSNILKNPAPGSPDDLPVPEKTKKTGLLNVAGTAAQHPFLSAAGVAGGMYGVRKFTPQSVKDTLTGGKSAADADWPRINELLQKIRENPELDAESKAKAIHQVMKPYLKKGVMNTVGRAMTGEPEFWDGIMKRLVTVGRKV